MSIVRGSSSFVSKLGGRFEVEPLERRDLFAIARPSVWWPWIAPAAGTVTIDMPR